MWLRPGGRGAMPVLLAHGGGQTRRAWKRVMSDLADAGFRAIAVDVRGHGDSSWSRSVGEREGVLNVNAKVPHRALDPGMAEQDLDRPTPNLLGVVEHEANGPNLFGFSARFAPIFRPAFQAGPVSAGSNEEMSHPFSSLAGIGHRENAMRNDRRRQTFQISNAACAKKPPARGLIKGLPSPIFPRASSELTDSLGIPKAVAI